MLNLFILFIVIIFKAEARDLDNDPVEIIFNIHAEVSHEGAVNMICDHTDDSQYKNNYTILEGYDFQIYTKYNSSVNHVICKDYFSENVFNADMEKNLGSIYISTFKAERRTNTIWRCSVLLNHDILPSTYPTVQYNNVNYTAAYCYMRIHVRLNTSPLTILVNNMELQTHGTDLSEKDVDFTAEYHYADGDVVNVTCVDFLNRNDDRLTMELSMAGTIADKLNILGLKYKVVGFIANLHSGHNNSYMLCKELLPEDETTVMVRFVMLTEFHTMSVRINGMTIRPPFFKPFFYINYKYESLHPLNVVCEVHRTDYELRVTDDDFLFGRVSSYKKTGLIPAKKAEMSFYLNRPDDKTLGCRTKFNYGINVRFTAGNFSKKQHSLHITSSNGTAMDSYISDDELKFIFYEYNDGETLQLTCGPLLQPNRTLEFGNLDACNTVGCTLSKSIKLSRQDNDSVIFCSLQAPYKFYDNFKPHTQIIVLLRPRVLTTTSPVTALNTTSTAAADPASSATSTSNTLLYCGVAAGVAVIAIFIVGGYWTVKKRRCCARSTSQELPTIPTPRPDPASVFYVNLLSIFRRIDEREAAEIEMENIYEEVE